MAILAYARVSTQDQDLSGQIEALTAAGATSLFKEKISGARAVGLSLPSSCPRSRLVTP
jgi:DNA invertase Pin-like site-specific DNA recombinase